MRSASAAGCGRVIPSDRFFVKICGITTEEDALLAVGLGATAIGFIFAPRPASSRPSRIADIVKRLPADTVTVGRVPRRVAPACRRDRATTPG